MVMHGWLAFGLLYKGIINNHVLKKPWMQSADSISRGPLATKDNPPNGAEGPGGADPDPNRSEKKKPSVIRPSRKLGSGSDLMEYSGINKGTTGRGSSALPNYNNPKMSSFFSFQDWSI